MTFSLSSVDPPEDKGGTTRSPRLSVIPGAQESTLEHLSAADQEIVFAIRSGSKLTFDTLYLGTYDALIAFAARYVHSNATAEDIIQDVFLSIWNSRDSWAPVNSVRAYLFTAVRNRALKQIRHANIVETSFAAGNIPLLSAPPEQPDEAVETQDRITKIRETLKSLPERQATALMLRWQRGLTYPEIASVLGISAQAARTLILRVQERLKTLLDEDI